PGGSGFTASLDLTGVGTGVWDGVVTNPDDASSTLPAAFSVEEPRAPDLWLEVAGPHAIRAGVPALFTLTYGNRGNSDALAVPLSISLPDTMDYRLLFPVAAPPPLGRPLPLPR